MTVRLKEDRATEKVRRSYDRIARVYDLIEGRAEKSRLGKWRRVLWSRVEGKKILEVGAGTGTNFPYYPEGTEITAIDLSEGMLWHAREKVAQRGLKIDLRQMDVQHLDFADNTFDSVVASFVFCAVPDPVQGLREVRRVLKPGAKLVMLEHVLSERPFVARIMNLVNPLTAGMMGENINRRTVEHVGSSGLIVEKVTDVSSDIFKLIEARKGA